jgi:signal transduction histidine kinase
LWIVDVTSAPYVEAYRGLIAHVREPLLLISSVGVIIAINSAGAETIGATVASLEGAGFDAYAPELVVALQSVAVGDASFPLRTRDGRRGFSCHASQLAPDLFVVRVSGGPDAAHRARGFLELFARLQAPQLEPDRQPLEDLARTLLSMGTTAVGAIAGGVYVISGASNTLELLASVGYPRHIIDSYRVVPLAAPLPLSDSVRTASPIFLGTKADFHAKYDAFATSQPAAVQRAMACIPLVVDGRCVGTLGLGFPMPWRFTQDERAALIDLGQQFANTLSRAGGERTVRQPQDSASSPESRLERLHVFMGALARAITPAEVGEVVADGGSVVVGARSAGLWLRTEDGQHVRLARAIGPTGPLPEQHMIIPLDRPARMPILDAIQTGAPVWIESCAQLEALYPDAFRAFSRGGDSSLACIPLLAQGRCIGGLAYNFDHAHEFREDERVFLQMVGWHAAQALERSHLFAAEKLARGAAEASQRRSAFLADINALLASLDAQSALSAVAAMAVPRIADWCIVHLAADGRAGLLPVAAHVEPEKLPRALEISRRVREEGAGDKGIGYVMRTGKSLLTPSIPPDRLRAALEDKELAELILATGLVSAMVVPILARGQVLGAIVLNSATPGRHYDEHDLAMAENLGRKLGLVLENARLYREVRDDDRRKDEFIAMLSHELRNPLVPIVAAVDLMRLQDEDTFVHEREMIRTNARHLVRLVDELLDVSRIRHGKIELKSTLCEAADLVADAMDIAGPTVSGREHRLSVSAPTRGLRVVADRIRMAQAIANLVINAAKYTAPRGEIVVSAAEEAGEVVFRVRDNGIGMEPDLLPRIFDLFVQASSPPDRVEGGLGVGLTVVKNIVTLHGGVVAAQSPGPGKGSELVIRLPRPDLSAIASTPVAASALPSPRPRVARAALNKRVLIVEDDRDVADVMRSLLEAVGYSPVIAHDGASALAAAPELRPELALIDLGLPVMDGYEVCRRLRSIDAHLRIIAVTGYGQESDRARTKEAGFDEHIVKPIELEALRQLLRSE